MTSGGIASGAGTVGRERRRRDRIFTPRNVVKLASESALATAELEDALTRQQVHQAREALRTPEQAIVGDGVVASPVVVAEGLAQRKRLHRRIR